MRIPILLKDNKNTYKDEYNKILKVLNSKCIVYEKNNYNYFEFVNTFLFHHWKYRNTYLDCDSYLKSIGIDFKHKITEESFLNFLEFLLNIQLLLESMKKFKGVTFSDKASSVLFHNVPLIIERMGYSAFQIDDKVYLLPSHVIYDDLLDYIPDTLNELLISYRLIENNGLKMKRLILSKIFPMILDYKSVSPSTYSLIKMIVCKMGIVGEIDSKYKGISRYKLKKYYDYCYEMICYLIESQKIQSYKEELKGE